MDLNKLLERQNALLPIEIAFKELYQKHPSRNLQRPHTPEEDQDFLRKLSLSIDSELILKIQNKTLDEDTFFQSGYDIELYRHLRYLPAYWHSHSFLEVICVFQGNCTNYILQQQISMRSGDICIIAPNTLHTICAFSDDCIIFNIELRISTFEEAFWGTLSGNDILSDFFSHILYHSKNHPYLFFRTNGDKELFDYVLYAYMETINNHMYKNRMLSNVIMAFFTILLRKHGSEVILPEQNIIDENENVVFLLKYIQEHYSTVTLSELANFFNYSERQIQRIIKDSTGSSFRENVQKLKMKKAARLLENPNMSIASISEELGYLDMGNFRHLFKKYYGMTPMEFRVQKSIL